ncbi:hypothetical protein BQ8420_24875 [Nocardiopsis sp. JB363]|nr:hypothetical protein BQ8420_24875 [Nocardiopsis sp. JB363]
MSPSGPGACPPGRSSRPAWTHRLPPRRRVPPGVWVTRSCRRVTTNGGFRLGGSYLG